MTALLVCQFYFFFRAEYDILVWLGLSFGLSRKEGIRLDGLILASRSPRRCELLSRLGLPFETDAPDVDESCSLPASEAVQLLSRRKAAAASALHPGCWILGADTLVSLGGQSLGKPKDESEAVRMLRSLSGNTHQVFTGVTVISPSSGVFTALDCTEVTFDRLTDEEILSYVRTGEPMDKAGAYALQGLAGAWVTHLDGSDSSVIGLPLYLVRRLLIRSGFHFPA